MDSIRGICFTQHPREAVFVLVSHALTEVNSMSSLSTPIPVWASAPLTVVQRFLQDDLNRVAVALVATFFLIYLQKRKVPRINLDFPSGGITGKWARQTNVSDATMSLRSGARPGKLQCFNPGNGEHLGEVAAMTQDEVFELVNASRVAQAEWSKSSFDTRRYLLRTFIRAIIDYQKDIAHVCVRDSGKTYLGANFGEVIPTLEKLQWMIDNGEDILRPQNRNAVRLMFYKDAIVSYEPLGVLAILAPFNYPFTNLINHVISGLFAGNGVVIKVSEHTSWSSQFGINLIKEAIMAIGYSPDLVQLITGFPEAGQALVASNIDKIIFTGSTHVGKMVLKAAADRCIPCVMELGGKDPFIVCDDADLMGVFSLLVRGCFQNAGQNCIGVERVFVQDGIYDAFIVEATKRVQALRQGCPTDGCPDVGATTMEGQLNLIESLVNDALERGATALVGGKRARSGKLGNGLYFEPTLLVDVDESMRIYHEEAFGPLMVVVRYATDEEMIDMVNSSKFGLASSIFTNNINRGEDIAKNLNVGMVNLNDFGVNYMVQDLPFGGVKWSGFGRFGGPEGLRECCNVKSMTKNKWSWLTTSLVLPPLLDYPVESGSAKFTEGLAKFYYGLSMAEKLRGCVHMVSCLLGFNNDSN